MICLESVSAVAFAVGVFALRVDGAHLGAIDPAVAYDPGLPAAAEAC